MSRDVDLLLAYADPSRWPECARPGCSLLFLDTPSLTAPPVLDHQMRQRREQQQVPDAQICTFPAGTVRRLAKQRGPALAPEVAATGGSGVEDGSTRVCYGNFACSCMLTS
jgi:hypothetical protein